MIGKTVAHYKITSRLGAGAMGEVWRAADTKLGRDVALKVLPKNLATDPERLQRFEREAKAVAALNHPNVVTIHSVEKAEGLHLLTMELVEGQSLDQILPATGFDLDQLFPLAIQITAALVAAHDKGIVHRDLKPANVMVTDGGHIKVLDFGLAKLAEADVETQETQLMTQAGMVLGTVPYMSPEGVQGQTVDHRSDIFSLGIMLYEMVTGSRPFQGENPASVISAILKDHPATVTELKAELPQHLGRIVRRCLEKQPQRRYQSAREILLELEGLEREVEATESGIAQVAPAIGSTFPIRNWRGIATAAILASTVAVIATYMAVSKRPQPLSPPLHAELNLPDAAPLGFGLAAIGVDSNLLALSPDGTVLVYVGRSPDGGSQLYRRELTGFDPPAAIPGTEGAHHAFFSPNGASIGFVTVDKLKRVTPNGDGLQTIAPITTVIRGQWAEDDFIYLGAHQGRRLQRVSVSSGEITDVYYKRDTTFLEMLPGGRSALVMIRGHISADYADIAVLDLEALDTRIVLENGYDARLMGSDRLVFARAGSVLAVPFDADEELVHEEPVTVMRDVVMDAIIGQAQFAFSNSGRMVFAHGPQLSRGGVARVDREGNHEFLSVPVRTYGVLDLDPSDQTLALEVADVESYVWTYDMVSGRGTRMPGRHSRMPVWSNSGEILAYQDNRDETLRFESIAATATAPPSIPNEWSASISSWSPNDELLAINRAIGNSGQFGFLELKSGTVAWVENAENLDWGPAFSPDGKWVAYSSNATGAWQIWIRSYPDSTVIRQISDAGGIETVWGPSGEIFYRRGDQFMSVAVTTEPTLNWSAPQKVFETDFIDTLGRSFDVSSDGQYLYVVKQPDPRDDTRLHVVDGLNFQD